MGFQVGHAKHGGRKKGTKDKKQVLRVEDVLLAANLNPVNELLKLLPLLMPKDAARVLLELQSYIEPKPKAVDVPPETEDLPEPLDGSNDELLRALDANVHAIKS